MIRLHEFITKIRNCKTQAQERAEYQKQMAAIRESFAKNEQTLRPRNVTKLLFINMSGQETNFGQMECLKLITANSLIEKRIGYLGLTQLFHEKSELLMMATNRIRIDLNGNNNNIISLTLCVLSQICTAQLARDLHQDVLKCISNNSAYIRKKAILTAVKIVKRVPQYIPEFLPKISHCLEEKSHGVLLSCMSFLQSALQVDESLAPQVVDLVPKIARAYRLITQEHNAQYEIGGIQDPFLQVSVLKLLRTLRKISPTFDKQLAEVLMICHDSIASRATANLKNGANAVLFECFQCFMTLQATAQLRNMVSNVLSKFISVKDANAKYLSLFNLSLMTKYDVSVVRSHEKTIFECLEENDILIRIMALDLLYTIAAADNSPTIVKELLNVLLSANDEQFISQLSLKICLIVEKHSISRRWHFDTILKVLVLADQSVKEESAKSLVYLVQSTPQLQEYCMTKLFFSTAENPQNDALSSVTLFLIGELSDVLFKLRGVEMSEKNVLDLIESVIFKIGIGNDTISYGLSTLLKLYEKFRERDRISKMIKSFEAHSDLEVQKRACEYAKLLESSWDADRKREICVTVQPFKPVVDTFRALPVGDTQLDIDVSSLHMPGSTNVDYDAHMVKASDQQAYQAIRPIKKDQPEQKPQPTPVVEKPSAPRSIIDDDIMFGGGQSNQSTNPTPPSGGDLMGDLGGISFGQASSPSPPAPAHDDPFGLMGVNMGHSQPSPPQPPVSSGFGDDLMGFGDSSSHPSPQPQPKSSGGGDLIGGDFMAFGGNTQPTHTSPPVQSPSPPSQSMGFDFGSGSSNPPQVGGLGSSQQPPAPKPQNQSGFVPINNTNPNKIMAYENQHIQIWMDCIKESQQATKLFTTFVNKTNNSLSDMSIQAAVLKHVKLVINPLSSSTLQPFSKEVMHQTMHITNTMVGQKGVVMKLKVSYSIATQKYNFEEKVSNFPAGV